MMNNQKEYDSEAFFIKERVGLADKTWFKTGGVARFYVEPATIEACVQAVHFAQKINASLFILGEGANVLVSDEGFDGLVIRPVLNEISYDAHLCQIKAAAGVSMNCLIEYMLDHAAIGLEDFSLIPGTVGGSVFINIHYFEKLLSDFLVGALVLEYATGSILSVDREWFQFGYNQSTLQQKKHMLIQATFQVMPADQYQVAYARGRRTEIIRHRQRRYPVERTCGSFFRNFLPDELGPGQIPHVAYYLDAVGVKGTLQIGGARVSHKHANMLVSSLGATSADILACVQAMQEKVFVRFGLIPQPECQLVGFDINHLHLFKNR